MSKLKTEKKINRGTGAGGSKTNENGKKFEKLTDNVPNLLKNAETKKDRKSVV